MLRAPEGHIVATTDTNGVVVLWDAETGREIRRLLIGERSAQCSDMGRSREALRFEFVADSEQLLMDVSTASRRVEMWSIARGVRAWMREGHLVDVDRARGAVGRRRSRPGRLRRQRHRRVQRGVYAAGEAGGGRLHQEVWHDPGVGARPGGEAADQRHVGLEPRVGQP